MCENEKKVPELTEEELKEVSGGREVLGVTPPPEDEKPEEEASPMFL